MAIKNIVFNKLPKANSPVPDGFVIIDNMTFKKLIFVGLVISLSMFNLIRLILPNYQNENFSLSEIILLFVVLIIHELIHGIVSSKKFFLKDITFGFIPLKAIFYCYQENKFSKYRYLLIIIAPLFFLTIFPLIIVMSFNITNQLIVGSLLINCLVSGPDVFNFFYLLVKLPNDSIVTNRGANLYMLKTENNSKYI